jgi:hypothetical protein
VYTLVSRMKLHAPLFSDELIFICNCVPSCVIHTSNTPRLFHFKQTLFITSTETILKKLLVSFDLYLPMYKIHLTWPLEYVYYWSSASASYNAGAIQWCSQAQFMLQSIQCNWMRVCKQRWLTASYGHEYEISGSHGSEYEESGFQMWCNVSARCTPTFYRNTLSPSSELKITKLPGQNHLPSHSRRQQYPWVTLSFHKLACHTSDPWGWLQIDAQRKKTS